MKKQQDDILFHPEALNAMLERHGAPLGAPGFGSWLLAAFIGLILSAVIVFLAVGRYSRKETVVGQLTPPAGAIRVTSVRPGVATRVFVSEGARVKRGQPLLQVSYDMTTDDGGSLGGLLIQAADAEARASESQVAAELTGLRQQRTELSLKRNAFAQEQQRLAIDIALQEQRLRLLEDTVTATRVLFDKQLISAVQMRQREEGLLAVQQTLNAAEGARESSIATVAQLDTQIARIGSQIDAQKAAAGAAAARRRSGRAQLVSEMSGLILSQRDGRVAALQTREGAPIPPNATLALVLGEAQELTAELWVPSRAIGFVRGGTKVRLMFDAFPYQRFGIGRGVVEQVGTAPVLPEDLPIPVQTNESLYRVIVRLDETQITAYGEKWHLSPGMRLTADIVLDERPLLAWVFEPLLAVRERTR